MVQLTEFLLDLVIRRFDNDSSGEDKMSNLRSLGLFLTESCNLACPYCFAANMEREAIDKDLAKKAIDLLFHDDVKSQKVHITFWGGEPLLEFKLMKELVLYAEQQAEKHEKQLRLGFPTNTILLSDDIIDFLQEHNVRPSLSLDGDEAAQSLRRNRGGKSSFPKALEKLELIKKRYGKQLPGVRMTVSPATADSLYHNVRFFLDQGFRAVHFAPVHEADWSSEVISAYKQQQLKLADEWIDRFLKGTPFHVSVWEKSLAWLELCRRQKTTADGKQNGVPCGAGDGMLAVDIYGDIYACHRFVFYDKQKRAEGLGNVRNGLPKKEQLQPYLEFDAHTLGTAETRCADCEHRPDCFNTCPAVNYSMTGDIFSIHSRFCQLTRIDFEVAREIETRIGDHEKFLDYRDNYLLKNYAPGSLSASALAFFADIDEETENRFVDRVEDILQNIQEKRRKK